MVKTEEVALAGVVRPDILGGGGRGLLMVLLLYFFFPPDIFCA